MSLILLKNPSVWFLYIKPTEQTRGIWLNLALVTQVFEYLTRDGDDISIKVLMVDGSTLIFHGERALTVLQELERIGRTESKTDFSCVES